MRFYRKVDFVKEIEIEAKVENLYIVLDFINDGLNKLECPLMARKHIEIAAEEIFVNISNYAYSPEVGTATIRVEIEDDPMAVCMIFIDGGVQYDPLKKEDPDITLPAEDRPIGGLGIFMTKKCMDDIMYTYENGKNILTLKKNL